MPSLAIAGGTPVRTDPYPPWPDRGETDVEAVAAVVRDGDWGGFPEPGRARRGVRGAVRRLPGGAPRDLDVERDRHDGGGAQGAGHRLGRRGDRARPHVQRHGVRTDRGRRAAGVRRHRPEDAELSTRHAIEAAITPQNDGRSCRCTSGTRWRTWIASWPSPAAHGLAVVEDCAHAHGQRWNDVGAGLLRGVRLVQPSILEDPDRGRRRLPAGERRRARPARALDHRLRQAERRRRAGVHVRRQLPARGAPRRVARGRARSVPGSSRLAVPSSAASSRSSWPTSPASA